MVPLYAQTGTITLRLNNVSVKEALRQVESKTNYTFLYQDALLKGANPVQINAEQQPLSTVLGQILLPSGLTYEVDDNVIVLKRLPTQQVKTAERIVTGRILDNEKQTLPGASVKRRDKPDAGVVSDLDGFFSLSIPADGHVVLTVSFVGMESKEVVVTPETKHLDIQLNPSEVKLKDFVVVGAYGTQQKRSDLVGSAFQVNAKQLETLPIGRLDNLLDGMVPGLKIDYNTDLASNTRPRYNIRVRGSASLSASNEPLWIVDGVPVYTGDRTNLVPGMSMSISPLSYYNAEDIESITVLKDAATTSIYGADGANGVILVTTKKGSGAQKTSLTVSSRFGVSKINEATRFKVLNADQYRMLAMEAYRNAGRDMALFPFQDNAMNTYSTTETDWSKVFYDLGNTRQTSLTLRGSNEYASYYLSGAYYGNNLTVKGNQNDRFSLRSNTDFNLTNRIQFGLKLGTSYNVNTLFNPGDDYYQLLPIFSPYNADGSFRLYNTYVDGADASGQPVWLTRRFLNPLPEREENDERQRTMATQANAELKITLLKGVVWTNQLGADYQSAFEDRYMARSNWSGMNSQGEPYGYASRSHANFLNLNIVERLNVNRTFNRHKVGGVLGFEATSKEYNTLGATGSGFVNDHIKEVSYATDRSGSSSNHLTRGLSLFAQGTYSFDNRYYLLVNTRRDGRSNFGPDVRWAEFASAGLSWNAHNEAFIQPIEAINVLKFKFSYGSNGNSRLGSLEALGLYSYSSSDQYAGMPGASMSGSPNPTLSWETTYMTNFGVRIRAFDRIDLDVEAYNNKTVDLLSNLDVSRTTGDTRVYRNVGSIRNRGVEATLEAELYRRREVEWTLTANLSHNKNTLLELYNEESKVMGDMIWMEGHDIDTYYLVRWAGVDPRDGAPLWYDAKGNLTRTYDTNNRVPWKAASPIATGGFSSMLQYKAFSVNILFSYVLGGYSFSNFGRRVSSDGLNIMDENQSINQLDRWQKPGDLALSPKPLWGISTKSVMNSTRYVYSTTHLKLRNMAFNYRLPNEWIQRLGGKTAHVSLIADNLGVWTPFDKKDRNSYRQAMSGYPMETMVSLGLDLAL